MIWRAADNRLASAHADCRTVASLRRFLHCAVNLLQHREINLRAERIFNGCQPENSNCAITRAARRRIQSAHFYLGSAVALTQNKNSPTRMTIPYGVPTHTHHYAVRSEQKALKQTAKPQTRGKSST